MRYLRKVISGILVTIMLLSSVASNVTLFSAPAGLPEAFATPGYQYSPAFNATGTNFFDVPDNPSLHLQKFSLAAWFKTTKDYNVNAVIASKGGLGSGENLNYGIWLSSQEKIRVGFKSGGVNEYVTHTNTYNDGNWHYAVVTYDGSKLTLYVDGVALGWRFITAIPDTSSNAPLRIGANAPTANSYFQGQIDEVRVWSRVITAGEVADQYNQGIFNTTQQLVYMDGVSSNSSPIANAGPDLTSNEGTMAFLNGASSSDPDGNPLTYSWIQTAGPNAVLSSANISNPSFQAPLVNSIGATLTFELTVSDGPLTSKDVVNVEVENINQSPIANAGPDQAVNENSIVALNGSASSDPDIEPLTYSWVQTVGPTVTLSNPTAPNPTFTAPNVGPDGSSLKFVLTVNDASNANATDDVNITIQNTPGVSAALSANKTSLYEGEASKLDASNSTGNIVSYTFEQIAGILGTINPDSSNPSMATFIAPSLVPSDQNVTLKVTVTDAFGETSSTTQQVMIKHANQQPRANSGPVQSTNEGSIVTLAGTASSDPDSAPQPLTYSWHQIDASGFTVALSNSTSPTPSFTAPEIAGDNIVLTFRLTVNDGLASDSDTVSVTVNNLAASGYHYSPSFNATGSGTSYIDIPDSPSLHLQKFSLAAWFKTTKDYYVNAVIADKGGLGSGEKLNYGIWMSSQEKLRVGFKTADGTLYYVTHTNTYNDGNWHYAVVTYDGSKLTLYVDGVALGWRFITAIPDTSSNAPLRIGANAPTANSYFQGQIDEVRVWSRVITAGEVADQYNQGIFNTTQQLVYMDGVNFNRPPVAKAGPDQTVNEGTLVMLDGTASSDPDGNPLTYSWVRTAGPAVTLSGANTATPSFTAPPVNATGATITFKLTVSDGKGGTATDTADVIVKNINQSPVANAGPDQTVDEGTDQVILDGTASYDPDSDPLTYSWVQTAGPAVSFDDPNAQNPSFTAPLVAFDRILSFRLTVSDGGLNSTDVVSVTIINTAGGYEYSPPFDAKGSGGSGLGYYDVPDSPSLHLQKFSLAAWFKTTKDYYVNAVIADKGGLGSGEKLNYGIWMSSQEKLRVGFKTADGTLYYVTHTNTYNDGNWHYAVVTYDGSKLTLYVDGVALGWRFITAIPDTSSNAPLRIGANAPTANSYFQGQIDEVRVWNRVLFASEVADQYLSGIFGSDAPVVYMNGVSHNYTPIAKAGPDQTVNEGTLVMLDGTASSDPDGNPLTYSWVRTAGPAVTLSGANTATPSFTAPIVAFDSTLSFLLTVSDGKVTDTDVVEVKVINTVGGYQYSPDYALEGGNFFDVPDSSSLRLQTFSAAAWFKTSTTFTSSGMIFNKGGLGSDAAGNNLNYGIWIDNLQRIMAGFESQQGFAVFVTSPNSYNDGIWHYATVTFDNSVVRLYIDGEQVASKTVSGNAPDRSGNQPLRVGANSLSPDRYFQGEIDEVRIWNRAITSTEAANQYYSGIFSSSGLVQYIDMSHVPIADAGSIQVVQGNSTTSLNGAGSFDPDGSPLTYSWIQLSGPAALSIQNANSVSPTVRVPNVSGEESLIFKLAVSDGQYSAADNVRIVDTDPGIKNKILGTPDYANDVVAEINNATTFVYAAFYFVEPFNNKIIDALENATHRGVDVKVVLAPQSLDIYPGADQALTDRGIPNKVISNHVKLVVIDNKTAYVGSANWNRNGMSVNREISMKTNNPDTINEEYEYITVLWNTGNKIIRQNDYYFERLVNGYEFYDLLLNDLKNSHSIKMLMFEMTYNFTDPLSPDTVVLNELKKANDRGADLQIVLDDPRYYLRYGGRQFLTENAIPHKLDYKNTGTLERLHAKAWLIDDQILYLGSINWNADSLTSPQEASLITRNPQTIAQYMTIFNQEWSLGHYP